MPRKLSFGDEKAGFPPPSSPVEPVGRRKLNLPTQPAPPAPVAPAASTAPVRRLHPKETEVSYARAERPKTQTDYLVDQAVTQSPTINPARVRGRIAMLFDIRNRKQTDLLINWGEGNLTPLQQASDIQAKIANELERINATGIIRETMDHCRHAPSLYDRLAGKNPATYDFMLRQAKSDLTALMVKSGQQRELFKPEVEDLHLDAISLSVMLTEFVDPTMANIANSRVKTILMAHQTGTILLQVLEDTANNCAQSIQSINDVINVTIPNWKIAAQRK